ncbi:MAG: phosphoethanolamine--lipid A transferase [Spongiibacteraceae bacterium]
MTAKKYPTLLPILFAALFLTITANYRFFTETLRVYPLAQGNALFLFSTSIVLLAFELFLLALVSLCLPYRWAMSFILLLASATAYFSDKFGTIIDTSMIRNILQTDAHEALDLATWPLFARIILLGVLPAAALWKIPTPKLSWTRRSLYFGSTAVASLLMAATIIFMFSGKYASFFREHKVLRTYSNPLMAVASIIQLSKSAPTLTDNDHLNKILLDAKKDPADEAKELVILVVGETAREDHFSLNGYSRQTNPLLEKETGVISYTDISSCGTSTAISVPCMFSSQGHNNFDVKSSQQQENLLDVLQREGVSVLWRDNNSGSKGVADRVSYEDFSKPDLNPVCDIECRDVGMLAGLQQFIDQQSGDILIVLHQMGNHGPAYFKRYPAEFEKFQPACHSLDLADCSNEEIRNAYDNAILYTDYFLAQVIQLLKQNTPKFETTMLYISDHGESLGEHGLYLHGAPYAMAPEEQTHVPLILWLSESSDVDMQSAIMQKNKHSSHDALFKSLLTTFEIEAPEEENADAFYRVKPPTYRVKPPASSSPTAQIH